MHKDNKEKKEIKTSGFYFYYLKELLLLGKIKLLINCNKHLYYSYFFLPVVFSKIIVYIVVLILIALDFWICKNIIGRKLVKLRWWYIINDDQFGGSEKWIFEHRYCIF